MEEKSINTKESLEIISRMISTTRESMEHSAAIPFLSWGYATVITSIAIFILCNITTNPLVFWLWFAIPIIGWSGILLSHHSNHVVKSPISKAISKIWALFGLLAVPFSLATYFIQIPNFNILFFISFFMTIGSLVTGILLQSKVLQICSLISIIAVVAILFCPGTKQILIFASVFLITMVIPGHIMLSHRKSR